MIPRIPDVKTPLLWLLGVLLAAAVAGLIAQHLELANMRVKMAEAAATRATETAQRATLAAADEKQTAGAQAQHAIDQQEIAHELAQAKQALSLARAGRADVDRRMRDTAAQLAAARAQLQAGGDAAPTGSCEHRHAATFGLLEEGHRLAAEGVELVGEGADLLAERDAEVKALAAQIQADRALMLRAAGQGLRVPPGLFKAPAD